MSYFSQFLNSSDDIVKQTAQLLEEGAAQLKDGNINQDEFNQLKTAALDFGTITEDVSDIERRDVIAQAFDSMLAITNTILSIPGI